MDPSLKTVQRSTLAGDGTQTDYALYATATAPSRGNSLRNCSFNFKWPSIYTVGCRIYKRTFINIVFFSLGKISFQLRLFCKSDLWIYATESEENCQNYSCFMKEKWLYRPQRYLDWGLNGIIVNITCQSLTDSVTLSYIYIFDAHALGKKLKIWHWFANSPSLLKLSTPH